MRGKAVCDRSIRKFDYFDRFDSSTFEDALHQLLGQEIPIHRDYHCLITFQDQLNFNYFFLKRGGKDVIKTRFADE